MSLLAKISTTADARSARLAGIGLMLVSVCVFAFGDTLGKFIVATYSVGQLLLLRSAAALIVLSPLIWRNRRKFLSLERPRLQLFRVVLSTLELAAIFVATLSAIVLRERVGWRRWSAILIGFCGVLIALRPSAQTVSWPAMIALAGSMAFAVLMLITRSLRATPDIVLASAQFIGSFAFGALLAPFGWIAPPRRGLGLFVAAGCTSVAALLCGTAVVPVCPHSV